MENWSATVRGFTIGGPGNPCRFAAFPDVLSTAPTRRDDKPRPYGHGAIAGGDYLDRRLVAIEAVLGAAGSAAAELLATQLAAAFAPADVDELLQVRLTGQPDGVSGEYAWRGRCDGVTFALDRKFLSGRLVARCRFVATDPIRYGPEQSALIDLADVGDGFVLPVVLPAIIDGTTGAGIGSTPNSGSIAVDWTATLTGPLGNPLLTHVESGQFIRVLTTIGAGDTVVLDSRLGAILLGVVARPDLQGPGSSWFELAPGVNSIRLTADTGTGTALITWRPGAA